MKIWDLRSSRDMPDTTFMLSDQVKVRAIKVVKFFYNFRYLAFRVIKDIFYRQQLQA